MSSLLVSSNTMECSYRQAIHNNTANASQLAWQYSPTETEHMVIHLLSVKLCMPCEFLVVGHVVVWWETPPSPKQGGKPPPWGGWVLCP